MKKIFNILLITFVSLISLLMFSTVKADKIILYSECNYEAIDVSSKLLEGYSFDEVDIRNNKLNVYYTDLDSGMLQFNYSGIIGIFSLDTFNSNKYFYSKKVNTNSYNEMLNSFKRATLENNNSCPLYLVIDSAETNKKGKLKSIKLLFGNDSNLCGYDGDGNIIPCKGVYKLKNHQIETKYPNEVSYTFSSTDNSCSFTSNSRLYVESSGSKYILKASYGLSGSKALGPANVSNSLEVLYNYYNGKNSYAKIDSFGFSSYAAVTGKYCPVSLKEGIPTCDKWNDVKGELNSSSESTLADLEKIKSLAKSDESLLSNFTSTVGVENWTAKNFSKSITCKEIKAYMNFYYNKLDPTYGDKTTSFNRVNNSLRQLEKELKDLDVCESEKDKYNHEINTYKSKIEVGIASLSSIISATETALIKLKSLQEKLECDIDIDPALTRIRSEKDYSEAIVKENLLDEKNFNFTSGCAIIGGDLKDFLNTVLFYIRLVAIILAVVLSLLDYIKAASASDDKPMSAANKRFITRLILVVVLFLLPVLLTFILNVLNINSVTGDSIECLEIDK